MLLAAPMHWKALALSVGLAMTFLTALVACGAATPKADRPENAGETSSEGHRGIRARACCRRIIRPPKADPVVGVTVKDEPKGQKALPCGGASVPDLAVVLGQAACEVPNAKPSETQRDLKDQLEITVATDAPKLAPGAAAKVTVTYHNKGKTELPLDFAVDPEPRFDFEVSAHP